MLFYLQVSIHSTSRKKWNHKTVNTSSTWLVYLFKHKINGNNKVVQSISKYYSKYLNFGNNFWS